MGPYSARVHSRRGQLVITWHLLTQIWTKIGRIVRCNGPNGGTLEPPRLRGSQNCNAPSTLHPCLSLSYWSRRAHAWAPFATFEGAYGTLHEEASKKSPRNERREGKARQWAQRQGTGGPQDASANCSTRPTMKHISLDAGLARCCTAPCRNRTRCVVEGRGSFDSSVCWTPAEKPPVQNAKAPEGPEHTSLVV